MNQIGIEIVLLDVFQAILVHPQHLEFANGVDLRWTDVDLHVGVVCSRNLLDLERFRHILAVANGEDDGMATLRQRVNHTDAEVTQGGIIGGGEPTQ